MFLFNKYMPYAISAKVSLAPTLKHSFACNCNCNKLFKFHHECCLNSWFRVTADSFVRIYKINLY